MSEAENPPEDESGASGATVIQGKYDKYFWVEWETLRLGDLLAAFPGIVLGKHLVNTSFDSGPLFLNTGELKLGWKKHRGLAISAPIRIKSEIPYSRYDEWYFFGNLPDLALFEQREIFINNLGFSLAEEYQPDTRARFWRQMLRISPDGYMAEGDRLILLLQEEVLYRKIVHALAADDTASKALLN